MTPNPEREIWDRAASLIRQHGEDAPLHAALSAERLVVKGDAEAAALWRRIGLRADELLAAPGAGQ